MTKFILSLTLLLYCCLVSAQKGYDYSYQDSISLKPDATLLPYNRIIHSAGYQITYGDPGVENHCLDISLLTGKKYLVVEDRYGIAVIEAKTKRIIDRWTFLNNPLFKNLMSTYSGIKAFDYKGKTYIVWGASGGDQASAIMVAEWAGQKIVHVTSIPFQNSSPAKSALPNGICVNVENSIPFLYAVLNGNDQLIKLNFISQQIVWSCKTGVAPFGIAIIGNKAYVTNWAGPQVTNTSLENAGVPWGGAYTNPATGATAMGSLSIIDINTGKLANEILLGLHPNAISAGKDNRYLYICNGNSDFISVVDVRKETVVDSISIGLFSLHGELYGSSPNALLVDSSSEKLFVANGMDNAVCVVQLGTGISVNGKGKTFVKGYIPTEAYPGGIALSNNILYVANIEAKGAHVLSDINILSENETSQQRRSLKGYTIHQQLASVSVIAVPADVQLVKYTKEVLEQNFISRIALTNLPPRKNVKPQPVPERIGEPSVFKHVVYIIKENKTYDQVFGDIKSGRGMKQFCVYGDSVTPNQHLLAQKFSLLDNYYASGKCSAEGHQWTDGAMVSDYIEKSVRAWFRSYPHRQEDALVYNKNGFIWNHALDHGKKVRVYGEACLTHYDEKLKWLDIYKAYMSHQPQNFYNTTTIARLRQIISASYPDCDNLVFSDQLRVDIFVDDWKKYEAGDNLPELMILSLPNDHTAGTSPGFPVPKAMVADNDLALGRIIDVISHSRYWDSTVVFVTEDDSQSGWDHISPYRTTGFVVSPYSVLGKVIHTNYNQTCMVRTIEQILGIPPMNVIDATALPMFDCFSSDKKSYAFSCVPAKIPLDRMNQSLGFLKGKSLKYAKLSAEVVFKDVDSGEDELMNKILWFDAKGNEKYPQGHLKK